MSKGTPLRNIRVPDEVWKPALARAAREGTNVSARVVAFLRDYGSERPPDQDPDHLGELLGHHPVAEQPQLVVAAEAGDIAHPPLG